MKTPEFFVLGLLLLSSSLSHAESNLLKLRAGTEFKVMKAIVLPNNMYEHQARGHYLEDESRFERRWNKDRSSIDHCTLDFTGPSAKTSGAQKSITLAAGTLIKATENSMGGGYLEKRTDTIPTWGDHVYRERLTGNYLQGFLVAVVVSLNGKTLPGVLSCEFSIPEGSPGRLGSDYLLQGTNGSLKVSRD